ncbi:hypothetical protein [Streptomyces sp. NBRC 109706]|uniref:hypothetical protein n=1 Tax=Streptomyces sp. NBRC 109706 TaxID=1550035 RepID=UPI00078395D5|nr:hypothetical protein [Streptomyces sp. NBRC 109706]
MRRHGITLTDIGVESRYRDTWSDHNDSVMVELGACRGNELKKLIRLLNQAPFTEAQPEESSPAG